MFRKLILTTLISFSAELLICAQDISFSQFNAVNLYYNPAFTGSFPGNYRVSSMYRNQWIGLQDRPLTQMAIAGDIKFSFGFDNPLKDFIGAGVYFNTDRSQVFDWNTNEMAIQLAYHKLVNKNNRSFVSGGFGFGVRQRSVNYDNLYFEDQFDGLDKYNGNTGELLPHNIHASPTLNFGIQYNSLLTRKTHFQIGLAVQKLFSKEYSFYSDFENPDYIGSKENQAFRNIIFISNLIYRYNNFQEIYPKLLVHMQGPHGVFITGFSYRQAFQKASQNAIHTGITTRTVKNQSSLTIADIGFQLGFELQNFMIGLHYDFGLKDATTYKSPSHSFEISLRLMGEYDNQYNFAPRF